MSNWDFESQIKQIKTYDPRIVDGMDEFAYGAITPFSKDEIDAVPSAYIKRCLIIGIYLMVEMQGRMSTMIFAGRIEGISLAIPIIYLLTFASVDVETASKMNTSEKVMDFMLENDF